jgi:hypothetical protein
MYMRCMHTYSAVCDDVGASLSFQNDQQMQGDIAMCTAWFESLLECDATC